MWVVKPQGDLRKGFPIVVDNRGAVDLRWVGRPAVDGVNKVPKVEEQRGLSARRHAPHSALGAGF